MKHQRSHIVSRFPAVALATLGLLLWMVHPLTHLAETGLHQKVESTNQTDSPLPDDEATSCLECLLLTTGTPEPNIPTEYILQVTECTPADRKPACSKTEKNTGYCLRAPPSISV